VRRRAARLSRAWLASLALAPLAAPAHVASNAFLDVEVRGARVEGSIELAVRDVELAVGVDSDGDRRITWAELRGSEARLAAYVAGHLSFATQGSPCPLRFGHLEVNQRVDGNYAWLPFGATCTSATGCSMT
jgi:hypothetical protein